MTATTSPPGSDGLEPIKRVKAVETEAQGRLAAFAERARAELDELRAASETFVARARGEAERARLERLESARTEAEREVARILEEGRARAAAIQGKGATELARLRESILTTILGEFRAKAKRSEA